MSGGGGGGGDEVKLLGLWASPFVLRVKLALSFKGLSYEYIEEDLYHKSQRLLSYNPVHKRVPVLLHNGRPICESRIIVQYVDEALAGDGPKLLPADPYDRATAHFWVAFIDDKLMPSWMKSIRGKTAEEKAEGREQTFAAVETLEAAFLDISGGGKRPFFGGDEVGYLDVVLGGVAGWVPAFDALYGMRLFDASRSPLLDAWLARFTALREVSAVVPDAGSLIEYAKKREVEIAAADAAAAGGK